MGFQRKPMPVVITDLAELKKQKKDEILKEAQRVGEAGIAINTGAHTFQMAATQADAAFLQQANQVAKMTWDVMGLPPGSPYRTAEIKEKWFENGEEKTRLHAEIPEAEHDAVLFQVVLYARDIVLRQEDLLQKVQDAETPEALRDIHWNMNLS